MAAPRVLPAALQRLIAFERVARCSLALAYASPAVPIVANIGEFRQCPKADPPDGDVEVVSQQFVVASAIDDCAAPKVAGDARDEFAERIALTKHSAVAYAVVELAHNIAAVAAKDFFCLERPRIFLVAADVANDFHSAAAKDSCDEDLQLGSSLSTALLAIIDGGYCFRRSLTVNQPRIVCTKTPCSITISRSNDEHSSF